MSYTPYYPNGWANTSGGGTPINAAALNNMEAGIGAAVEKAGDTMTGPLALPSIINNNPSAGSGAGDADYTVKESGINFRRSVLRTRWTAEDVARILFLYIASNNTNYTEYKLPSFDASVTENKSYDILTSLSPVTVAQGGTGGATKAAAKQNLGVMHGLFSIPQISSNSAGSVVVVFPAAFSSTGYDVSFSLRPSGTAGDDDPAAEGLVCYVESKGTSSMTVRYFRRAGYNQTIPACTMGYIAVGE